MLCLDLFSGIPCFRADEIFDVFHTNSKSNVLENGIVAVRSDSKVPEDQLEEWMNIRTKLNAAGGIYRSRTKCNDKLKEVCDLWRRVGSMHSILQQTPGMNHCIEMAIKKVTVARCNNRRIQMNTYTYNIVGKQKVILLI